MNGELRVKTVEDLKRIKAEFSKKIAGYKYKVMLCSGAGCISSESLAVKEELIKCLNSKRLAESVYRETGCMGTCDIGPVMIVMPEGVFYTKLGPEDVGPIVDSHLVNGRIMLEKLTLTRAKPARAICKGY